MIGSVGATTRKIRGSCTQINFYRVEQFRGCPRSTALKRARNYHALLRPGFYYAWVGGSRTGELALRPNGHRRASLSVAFAARPIISPRGRGRASFDRSHELTSVPTARRDGTRRGAGGRRTARAGDGRAGLWLLDGGALRVVGAMGGMRGCAAFCCGACVAGKCGSSELAVRASSRRKQRPAGAFDDDDDDLGVWERQGRTTTMGLDSRKPRIKRSAAGAGEKKNSKVCWRAGRASVRRPTAARVTRTGPMKRPPAVQRVFFIFIFFSSIYQKYMWV